MTAKETITIVCSVPHTFALFSLLSHSWLLQLFLFEYSDVALSLSIWYYFCAVPYSRNSWLSGCVSLVSKVCKHRWLPETRSRNNENHNWQHCWRCAVFEAWTDRKARNPFSILYSAGERRIKSRRRARPTPCSEMLLLHASQSRSLLAATFPIGTVTSSTEGFKPEIGFLSSCQAGQ